MLLLDHRKADADGSWARLRHGVLERLVAAEGQLPVGVRLLVVEGHRPAALQRRHFDEYCAELVAAGVGPPGISPSARHWREVLTSALTHVGLVNYPPEWWHWSYGDRYWAVVTGAPGAIHAPV